MLRRLPFPALRPLRLWSHYRSVVHRVLSTHSEVAGAVTPAPPQTSIPSRPAPGSSLEPGIDGAVFAIGKLIEGISEGRLWFGQESVTDALTTAVATVAEASSPRLLLSALTSFTALPDVSAGAPTTAGSLTAVWDAFADAGVRRADSVSLPSVVSAAVKHRAILSPRTVLAVVKSRVEADLHSTRRERRYDIVLPDGPGRAPRPAFVDATSAPTLTTDQWSAITDAVLSLCGSPVNATDSFYLMSAHALLGHVKATFVEFDRFEQVCVSADGTGMCPDACARSWLCWRAWRRRRCPPHSTRC